MIGKIVNFINCEEVNVSSTQQIAKWDRMSQEIYYYYKLKYIPIPTTI